MKIQVQLCSNQEPPQHVGVHQAVEVPQKFLLNPVPLGMNQGRMMG